ncbi:MAG: gliding motility-associated ABC transporter substrate-binding protein GldG [Prevotellaceae bacterium]|jgi:ABC-2 type transport system permease protein|nr:gliding motility-associated ABC transporter substrate-binding protein GldG [Prevotellaceae bacterium]
MQSIRWRDTGFFLLLVAAVILICLALSTTRWRIDLTGDKRYTLSTQAKQLLEKMDDVAFVRVYLDGDMPVDMRKLQRAIGDMLGDLRSYSGGNIQYEFFNPAEITSQKEKADLYRELYRKGVLPYVLQEKNSEGGVTQMELFPAALITMNGQQHAVNFLQQNQAISQEENINNAIQNLEYSLVDAIDMLSRTERKKIAFIEGHDELSGQQVADVTRDLSAYYTVNRVLLQGRVNALDGYDVAIVAKPRKPWDEVDKLAVDQFIMRGGKVAWFLDEVVVHEDSLANGYLTFGLPGSHNLDDMLFRYGVRLNQNVVQDLQCALIPVNVSPAGMPAKFSPMPWTYYPLLTASSSSPITRSLNMVKAEFPGTIDTLENAAVRKQILLTSSQYSLVKSAPFSVSLQQVTENVNPQLYNKQYASVAVLLSGQFSSIFRNRPIEKYNNGKKFPFIEQSSDNQQIVVADGDIIRNDVLNSGNVFPLGYDRYTKQILYGNKDFVRNVVSCLTDDNDLMQLRSKVITLRMLDRARVVRERTFWIVVNTVVPLVVLAVGGVAFVYYRKKKYGKK